MNQNVDYDYDEIIQYCQGEGQNSINELANSLNALSNEMESCQDAFHSKGNQMVIGEIYNAFSAIIGSTSTNNGVSGLDAESAKILNVCYSEAMKDKSILESDILGDGGSSGNDPIGEASTEPSVEPEQEVPENQQPATEQQPEAEPTPEQQPETTPAEESAPSGNIPGSISPGTTANTFPAQAYNLSPEEYNALCATIYAEAAEGNSYTVSDSMGVASAILNRLESGNWGGSTVTDIISASGQFSGYGYQNQKFAAAMSDPSVIPPEMRAAIDRTLAGERNTTGQSFSGNGTHNSFR